MVDFVDNVLPPECTSAIWTLLWLDDLCAVMRVSSTWARSASSVLYRDIKVSTTAQLQVLLQTTQRHPHLAASVHRLVLEKCRLLEKRQTQSLTGPAASLLKLLIGLRVLHLQGAWDGLGSLITAGRFNVSFDNLEDIELGSGRHRVADIVPIWALPNIRKVYACPHNVTSAEKELLATLPTASTLVDLKLEFTGLEEKGVAYLLEHAPALKKLSYGRLCDMTGRSSTNPAFQDCAELGRGLLHVRSSLEDLTLGVQVYSQDAQEVHYLDIEPVRGHLPSLRDFRSLRNFHVPIVTLLGWSPNGAPEIADRLPPSLQTLTLTVHLSRQCTWEWSEEDILDKLKTFVTTLAHTEHTLKTITMDSETLLDWVEDEQKQEVVELAATAGVEFIYSPA